MHIADFFSTGDTMIFMIPFLGLMALGMFRLDERFSAPKTTRRSGRAFCGVDSNGQPFLSDPDGRPWSHRPAKQIDATF